MPLALSAPWHGALPLPSTGRLTPGLRPKMPAEKRNDSKCIGNIFISKSIEGALKPYSILDGTSASRTDNKYAPPALGAGLGAGGRVASHKYRIRWVSIKYHPELIT